MRLSAICIVVIIAASFAAALPRIFPQPKLVTYYDTTLYLDPSFSFKASDVSSETLTNAFARYRAIILGKSNGIRTDVPFHGIPTRAVVRNPNAVTTIIVDVASKREDLNFDTNESYSIDTTFGDPVIKAETVYGALRGLESFSQIVDESLKMRSVAVYDEPRFPYRGFLLDTAHHFYPVSAILQHLDAMAYTKLNVLHWHIVDDISFPYESTTFPEMSATGAFSPKHVYTHADITNVIAYARARGIRVVPEFDVPGHVAKGYDALDPPILTKCYDPVPYKTGPLNPTIQATYDFLDKFYDELKYVWTDGVFHIGGDEVIKRCWKSNPEIVAWMEKHPEIDGYDGLQNYFIERLLDMLKGKGLSYMAWQEVFDSGADLLPDTVVEVWIPDGWRDTIKRVVESKRRAVLAAPFYLNLIKYGLDWPEFYKTDPADFPGGPAAEEAGHITGVEVCMWSEYVDATNFIPRSWARTAAVAERGWSPKDVVDVNEAQRRMHEWRCKMLRRGINAEPITNGANMTSPVGFAHNCEDEWEVRYTPPWV